MWKLAIAITLAVAVGVNGLSNWEYCYCSIAYYYGDHIAPCKNQTGANPGEVLKCRRLTEPEFSCMMIDYIVERQNDLRRKVASGKETRGLGGGQPPAANMNQLVWDRTELANMEGLFADCQEYFDSTCINETSLNKGGLSIMVYSNTTMSIIDAWRNTIDTWYSEVDKFNSSNIANYKDNLDNGNYARMMDADVNRIACTAVKSCEAGTALPTNRILACKYFYKENVFSNLKPKPKGSPLYEIGKPCSNCPVVAHSKARCFHHSLCENGVYLYNKMMETYEKRESYICLAELQHWTAPLEPQD